MHRRSLALNKPLRGTQCETVEHWFPAGNAPNSHQRFAKPLQHRCAPLHAAPLVQHLQMQVLHLGWERDTITCERGQPRLSHVSLASLASAWPSCARTRCCGLARCQLPAVVCAHWRGCSTETVQAWHRSLSRQLDAHVPRNRTSGQTTHNLRNDKKVGHKHTDEPNKQASAPRGRRAPRHHLGTGAQPPQPPLRGCHGHTKRLGNLAVALSRGGHLLVAKSSCAERTVSYENACTIVASKSVVVWHVS